MEECNNAQPRVHVHKSNVKLQELDVYNQHIVVIYLATYVSLSTFSLVS